MEDKEMFVWVEKHRPQKVVDCVLPKRIKKLFTSYVKDKEFPNLLLVGTAGTGKTTIALAMCKELDFEVLMINASAERTMDTIREKLRNFSSQTSLESKRKAVILDEADGLTTDSQKALRASMEQFPDVRFILTANFKNKLIEPIHSRTACIDFIVKKDEKQEVAFEFLKTIFGILDKENIKYNKKVIAKLVNKYYPDNRRIINELQSYAQGNENDIDIGLLNQIDTCSVSSLVEFCKDKNIPKIRKWVADNSDFDSSYLFSQIFEIFYNELEEESIPVMIIYIGEYQDKATRVANQEINMMAFIMELIGNVTFKN